MFPHVNIPAPNPDDLANAGAVGTGVVAGGGLLALLTMLLSRTDGHDVQSVQCGRRRASTGRHRRSLRFRSNAGQRPASTGMAAYVASPAGGLGHRAARGGSGTNSDSVTSQRIWDSMGWLRSLKPLTGSVPRDVIEANTACTLRAVGADNLHSQPLLVPSRTGFDLAATSASGEFLMSRQRLRAQDTAYLVQAAEGSAAGDSKRNRRGGLVEHNTFITAEADPGTHRELTQMGDAVYQILRLALTQVEPT
jgi:hypothetical protein